MSRRQLFHLWDFISRIAGAVPPIVVAMYYYPVWIRSGSKPMISGSLVLVVFIASVPFFGKLKSLLHFLTNASMPVLWLIGAGVSYVLMNVADQMFAICIGGLVGSAVSALICLKRNQYAAALPKEREENLHV